MGADIEHDRKCTSTCTDPLSGDRDSRFDIRAIAGVCHEKKGAEIGLSDAAVEAVVMTISRAPAVTKRRLSLRDAVRILERAEMLEGRPRIHQM